jgi:hypothetical protein
MKKTISLIFVIIYLISILSIITRVGYLMLFTTLLPKEDYNLLFQCILIGGLGGIIYCLRGVYLSYCVRKDWDAVWTVWYVIRPIVSLLCGGVSFLFLKAGLLVLEAQKEVDSTNLGFYALAFIAGLNVDKFIQKIEELAHATWGIEKSRSSNGNSPNNPQP